MTLRPVLALSVWLVAGTVQPTSAQLPLRHDPAAQACAAPAGAGASDTPEGHAILATVKRVDPGQGQLEFTTERGSFVLTAPPTELPDLRVGDQLLICLHEEMSEGKARSAADVPTATPKTREALPHPPDTTPDHRTMPLAAGREPTRR